MTSKEQMGISALLRDSSERAEASRIADRFLDTPFADPDGDKCVIARQFNRSQEEIERLRAALETILATGSPVEIFRIARTALWLGGPLPLLCGSPTGVGAYCCNKLRGHAGPHNAVRVGPEKEPQS